MIIRKLISTYNEQSLLLNREKSKEKQQESILWEVGTSKYELFVQSIKPKAVNKNEQVDELFTVWDTNKTQGAAVAIAKDGVIIYKKGYGIANLEYDIPIAPNSIFHIAISKQFTFSLFYYQKNKTS